MPTTPLGTTLFHAITDALAAGRTVYLQTPLRTTVITPKTAAKFASAGTPVVKLSASGSLLLASGRRYVDASYCALTIR